LGHAIRDNRDMGRLWLPLAIVVVLPGGCAPESFPPRPASPVSSSDVQKPLPTAVERPVAKFPAKPPEKLVVKPFEKSAEKQAESQPAHRLLDDFNLPLVIHMEAPEVPPEIENPSPPIQQKPESP
jgi:hypothetical protein